MRKGPLHLFFFTADLAPLLRTGRVLTVRFAAFGHTCPGRVRLHVREYGESRHRIPRRICWSTDGTLL